MQHSRAFASLFEKSETKADHKHAYNSRAEKSIYLSKNTKAIERKNSKSSKNKNDENLVPKVMRNVKNSRGKRDASAERPPKPQPLRPKTIEIAEPIEIEPDTNRNVELLYDLEYGEDMEKLLYATVVNVARLDSSKFFQPNTADSTRNTSVTEKMRSKMVDWMIEVLANYNQLTSHQTFFLSVTIMDMYLKHSRRSLKDPDVHLIGIAAMFLASKYDDVYHILLKDFVYKVAHNKFKEEEIKEMEWEILTTLDFNINYPTHLDILGRVIYKNFQDDETKNLDSIRATSIYILKMCLHDSAAMCHPPKILAYAALCYSIKCLFNNVLDSQANKDLDVRDIQNQEGALLRSILNSGVIDEVNEIQKCMEAIKELTLKFKTKYPDLKNLDRFSDAFQN